jgi:hypothetical protein
MLQSNLGNTLAGTVGTQEHVCARQQNWSLRMTHLAKASLKAGRPAGRTGRHHRMQARRQTPVGPQVYSCAGSRATRTA